MGDIVRGFAGAVCIALVAACGGPDNGAAESSTSSTSTTAGYSGIAPAGNYQSIPGTRIALRAPDLMRVESSLPGLARPRTRTTIVVLDQQRAPGDSDGKVLDDITASLADKVRSGQEGLTLDEPQRTQVAGFPAIVVRGSQQAAGGTFGKAFVALTPPDSVVIMTGTADPTDPIQADELLAVMRDARWNAERAPSELGIEVTPAPGYQKIPSSGSLLFTMGGTTGPGVPRFLVSPSQGSVPVPPEQRRAYAEQRFRKLPGSPVPQSVTEFSVADLSGWELTANSSDGTVYAAMVFTADGYVLMNGQPPPGQPDQLPAFREMARSLLVAG